jgi:predicted ArsR family transcriptional regulator
MVTAEAKGPKIAPMKKHKMVKLGALTNANLMKLLLDGTYSCIELSEETGLHYVTVLEYTRAMHRVGAVHINSWEKDTRGRDVIKVYKLGTAKDAKREKLTSVERTARYRAKRKAAQLAAVMGGQGKFIQACNGRMRFERIE